jgi:periplasmic divalent cation tolerance protein
MADGSQTRPAGTEEGSGICVALVTVPDPETGLALVREVVGAGLAACGNLIPGLTSVYRWKGKVHEDPECLIIFKTTTELSGALRSRVVRLHPYEVPEFLVFPVENGHPPYLEWVKGEVAETEMP